MRFKAKVITRSSVNQIEEITSSELKIKLTTAPVEGKANQKIIELLANHFKVSKRQVNIVKGLTSANKIIEIE